MEQSKDSKKKTAPKMTTKAVPLKFVETDDLKTIYANNLIVNYGHGEFYLTFCEVVPPFLMEGDAQALEQIEHVEAKMVARIAVPAARMKGFVEALRRNLDQSESGEE
ncbi:MAG: DUF3467 domain-containing protein [Coprothermobacterota bacterium]|nr:DUF3467 domain-containing protein [Coprothermobacterota bacterium]